MNNVVKTALLLGVLSALLISLGNRSILADPRRPEMKDVAAYATSTASARTSALTASDSSLRCAGVTSV